MSDILIQLNNADIALVAARSNEFNALKAANGDKGNPAYIAAVLETHMRENTLDRLYYKACDMGLL